MRKLCSGWNEIDEYQFRKKKSRKKIPKAVISYSSNFSKILFSISESSIKVPSVDVHLGNSVQYENKMTGRQQKNRYCKIFTCKYFVGTKSIRMFRFV